MSTTEEPPKFDLGKFEPAKDKLTLAKQNLAIIVSEAKSYSVQEHGIKLVEEQHKALKKLDKSMEDRRVELKKGPLEQCRLIDAAAAELAKELAPAIQHLADEGVGLVDHLLHMLARCVVVPTVALRRGRLRRPAHGPLHRPQARGRHRLVLVVGAVPDLDRLAGLHRDPAHRHRRLPHHRRHVSDF